MDFVIVGGGVYGCGVAWDLAQRGADVLLLEANTIASGASGGLGKRGVRANGRDRRELPLMGLAYDRWPTLHEELGGPTGYERIGHLMLFEREQDAATAPAIAWMQNAKGILTEQIGTERLHELEPALSQKVTTALYCPKDGIADHTTTTRSFAQAATRMGAQICEQTQVERVESGAGRVQAVITSHGERIKVGKALLLLSNSHVPTLLQQQFNMTLPIWQLLPQVMLTEPVSPMPLQHLIGHAHRVLAMKPHRTQTAQGREAKDGTGQVMISGGWRGQWDEADQRGRTVPAQVAGNLAEAVAVYPSLAGVGLSQADAGRLETVAVDGIPIIDHLQSMENLFYATGWSGHGWAIAPAVTRLMADWLWTGKRPTLLQPFSYQRFL